MININTITKAFTDLLNADTSLYNIAKTVHGEPVNEDINRVPWAGVYRGGCRFEPRTLGFNNWEAYPSVKILVQNKSMKSAEDCEISLEAHVQKIIEVASANKQLNGAVDMLNTIDVEYGFIETDKTSMYFQTAIITFEYEVMST